MARYAVGLDFGTLSARALVVDIDSGESQAFEEAYRQGTFEYDSPAVSRQDADDYLVACRGLLSEVARVADNVVGIGIDATASTPIPVDASFVPVSRHLPGRADGLAWLWKDHSSQAEAEEITEVMRRRDPERLARVGAYYAEWFWAKALNCARRSPDVFEASHTWLEQCDFITAHLTGKLTRGKCAAGHKALYHEGYPPPDCLPEELGRLAGTMGEAFPCSQVAGTLSAEWAEATGLRAGVPVAVGGVDAHLGAVGAGVAPGRVCLVLGTSACHMAVAPYSAGIAQVPGISGIANDSVLPGLLGLEAGQAAFGDLLDWAAGQLGSNIASLSAEAASVPPGANGVIVLDFHSGNRCPLADARLAGVILGQTLRTTRQVTFRAVVEACALGIRQILEMLGSAGVPVTDLVACGGVAEKNDFVLQTIADVTGKPVFRSAINETVALGSAIFGAVAGGAFASAEDAQRSLCRIEQTPFRPESKALEVYNKLYPIWVAAQSELGAKSDLLKRLLEFKESMR